MIGIVLAVEGYRRHPEIALKLACRAIAAAEAHTVIIDSEAVERAAKAALPGDDHKIVSFQRIPLARWFKRNAPDARTIRLAAASIPSDRGVLLDASAYPADLVSTTLFHAREAWFHLDQWHPAFVLICDDFETLRLARELAGTFRFLPKVPAEEEVRQIVESIRLRALALRWLGSGRVARIANHIHHFGVRLRERFG